MSRAIALEVPDTTTIMATPARVVATAYTPNINHPVLVTAYVHFTVAASQEARLKVQTMISGGALAEATNLSPRLAVPAAGPTLDLYVPVVFLVQPGGQYQLDGIQVVGAPTITLVGVMEQVL